MPFVKLSSDELESYGKAPLKILRRTCFLQQCPILLASTQSSMGQDKKRKRVQLPPNCSRCPEASKIGVPLPPVLFASLFSYLQLGLSCILLQHRTASKSFLLTSFLLLTIINTTAYISQNIEY